MTTFDTFDIDSVPAPSDYEFEGVPPPRFKPFVAVKCNRLITIIGKTTNGHYMDKRGYLHRLADLERDLDAYAEQARADARDQADTFADALR